MRKVRRDCDQRRYAAARKYGVSPRLNLRKVFPRYLLDQLERCKDDATRRIIMRARRGA